MHMCVCVYVHMFPCHASIIAIMMMITTTANATTTVPLLLLQFLKRILCVSYEYGIFALIS